MENFGNSFVLSIKIFDENLVAVTCREGATFSGTIQPLAVFVFWTRQSITCSTSIIDLFTFS